MSGPKTSNYTLTPEERARREELRRRELRRIAANSTLNRIRDELAELVNLCGASRSFASEYDLLTKSDPCLVYRLDAVSGSCEGLKVKCDSEKGASLEALEAQAKACEEAFVAVKAEAEALEGDLKEAKRRFAHRREAARSTVGKYSFAEIEAGIPDDRPDYGEDLRELMADRKVSPSVKERAARLCAYLEGASEQQLASFEAMYLKPLQRDADRDRAEYDECYDEYTALCTEYEGLCALCGDEPIVTSCSREGIAILKQAISQKSAEVAKDDEEGYIAESIDLVMEELGYHIVGERMVRTRSGRCFRHSLYHFDQGVVVDVTESADGKITMEIGAADTCDRLPTEEEIKGLHDSMTEFCVSFSEIEAKLAERGILPKRLSHMPVSDACAQVINVSEYGERGDMEAIGRIKVTEEAQQIRRHVRKARSLHIG